MRILILSCSTGGGHNTAAMAVKEQLEKEGHEAVFLDPFTLAGEKTAGRVGGTYVTIASRFPGFFGFLYRIGGVISSSRHKSPVYYANKLMVPHLTDYLAENFFDGIVTSHLFPAEMLTCMKHRRQKLPPVIAIATDYTCIPFWEETECDYYILPHEDLLEESKLRGLPEHKLLPFGIPVSGAFSEKADRSKARARLHLPEDKPVLLVMSGSMGFGKIHLFVFELMHKLTQGEHLIVICGNNQKSYRMLQRVYHKNPAVHITGFTDHVATYMDASDVVFTKPGGLTSTEALVKNIPIVHTAAIPGCEINNRDFFVSRGLSLASEHIHTQISLGLTLVQNKAIREAMLATQQKYRKPEAAAQIVHLLTELTSRKGAHS